MARARSELIRRELLEEVFWAGRSPVKSVARQFDLTRQAVQQHVRTLIKLHQLRGMGSGRWRRYQLVRVDEDSQIFPIQRGFSEDDIWERFVRSRIDHLSTSDQGTVHYGVTEMVNNAIDHSGGSEVHVQFWRTAISVHVRVADNGVGIFQKIASALGLCDPRQALLELGKGKFTTDPQRHTGEGVFFTSRGFDRFSLRSSNLLFTRTARSDDWLLDVDERSYTGTRVTMGLLVPAKQKLEDVFKRYSSGPEDYRFAKTHVPLRLATFGDESLISRSSARRVLTRVERFDEVLLDFKSVQSIGPAFADEIFRVFASQHPKVELVAINANEQVTAMIRRAKSAQGESGATLFDPPASS